MDKKQRNIKFFDSWAGSYDKFVFGFWLRSMHSDVLKFIAKKQKLKILDVSCGTGEMLLLMLRRLNKPDIYGVDISRNMLDIAKRKLKGRLKLKYADAALLPFKNNTFDYVITTESFHHYHNQKKSLMEMKRVLKKNGRLIIADVNFFFDIVHRIFEILEPGCVRVNSRKDFINMFKKTGFKDIKQIRSSVFGVITAGIKIS